MLVTSALIRKFKSIDDSGLVRFEPDVTCLVGRNESGKTAFLEALARANPVAGDPCRFDELRDYPRDRRTSERDQVADTVPVAVTFELSDADVEELWAELGSGVVSSREVRLERSYSGRRRLIVQQDDTGRARGAGRELAAFLMERLPRSLYFSHYSVLPGRVSIPRLQRLPSGQLTAGERTARSLLRLAGVAAPEDFAESAYELRKAALEAAAHRVSDEVFRYWSQRGDLAVELDVDFRAGAGLERHAGGPGPFLDIRIRDQRHGVTMNFGERSGGFVWFFSFVVAFSEMRDADQVIVLLDEPGLGLHAAAQADLLRYIREQLAPRHQVVYTTHSPFMVDPDALHRVRTVEDLDGEGTKIRAFDRVAHRDTLAPLQVALAAQATSQLSVAPHTLLVPEPADLLYLEIMSAHLRSAGRRGLDPRWVVVPSGGLHAVPTLAALLGAPLRAAVLVGLDSGPPQVAELVRNGQVPAERLLPLTELTGTTEASLEDLFDEGFYLELLGWAGVDAPRAGELPAGGGSLVRRIESVLGRPLDRYRPAHFLLINQANLLPSLGRATVNRFARLFERVDELEEPAVP